MNRHGLEGRRQDLTTAGLRALAFGGAALFVIAELAGCSAPGGPGSATEWDWRADAGTGSTTIPDTGTTTVVTSGPLTCTPARGSLDMPARATVMAADPADLENTGDTKVSTEDLFNLFNGNCGACHVGASLGNFHVTAATFAEVVDQKVLAVLKSDDPAKYMPPAGAGGAAYSSRTSNDPIVRLATLMSLWIQQGRPTALFTIPGTKTSAAVSYAVTPEVGTRITNIGDCVPSKAMVASSAKTMDDLDAFFAAATLLPETLGETDMTSLDGMALAQMGVIPYSPQYPLWSDESGKLRHIRVPRGKSIKFDKSKQTFDIPANTRFYKTFLKKVIDSAGNESYRKIETRIIVARPDKIASVGTAEPQALFGTYVWSEDELSATLSNVPLHDHTGFTDVMKTYTLDEPREQMIIDSKPANLKYALEAGATGLKRHYAVPGSQRCVQCHMGSVANDFVLGFLPLQIARRADGTGGGYDPTGPDELTQLQRFIDYGLITGMASPADVVTLENSQGDRKPRNDNELLAQAYLLGNCAHCHNPRGFPSVKSPALKDVLNFMPSQEGGKQTGGVFQFPLDKTSPLRSRGLEQNIPIPYITPSLREYPVADTTTDNWTTKWAQSCAPGSEVDPVAKFICNGRTLPGPAHLAAPWRSLIYRNVDTPFLYADDLVLFPHMPMNSAGFDCRAPRIMGDWMVSIPAARKSPEIDEDAVPGTMSEVDDNPQPYVEVSASDPTAFATASESAGKRLAQYHDSARYKFCPDTSDIVDPAVIAAGGDYPVVPSVDAIFDNKGNMIQPGVGVPNRAHWVVTDLTDVLGPWGPRRGTWKDVLVDNKVDMTSLPPTEESRRRELLARENVLAQIEKAVLTQELKDFVLTPMPYGLWQQKPECDFSSVPKVSDFPAAANRPLWMSAEAPPANAPVYVQTPAAAVFTNICINCHGPEADSKGLLADALATMTGGTGRVANFRGGLFGPVENPGANRATEFGKYAISAIDAKHPVMVSGEDWAARYLAWMALGGTLVKVPDALLNIVATTPVVGTRRSLQKLGAVASPNMLKLAQALCGQVLIPGPEGSTPKLDTEFYKHGRFDYTNETGLIDSNADAEMWQRLCSMGNRTVVRVPYVPSWSTVDDTDPTIHPVFSLFYGDQGSYPTDAPVMDDRGRITNGIQPDNLFPMCFRKPKAAADLTAADKYRDANLVGGAGGVKIPYCPDSLLEHPLESEEVETARYGHELIGADQWAARGAINAGFAVFYYVDALSKGKVAPQPEYNHCEKLKKN